MTILAVFKGSDVASARLVAETADPMIVAEVALALLDAPLRDDPVAAVLDPRAAALRTFSRGRRGRRSA